MNEEGGDGEGVDLEAQSLASYTLRYVSLAELDTLCRVGFRDPMHLCMRERGGWGRKTFVYYESIKRELNRKPTYDCWCDERLKNRAEDSTRLGYTGWQG